MGKGILLVGSLNLERNWGVIIATNLDIKRVRVEFGKENRWSEDMWEKD